MDIDDRINDQMRHALQINASLEAGTPADGPWDTAAYRSQYNTARAYWNEGGPVMVNTENLNVTSEYGAVACRVHYPSETKTGKHPVVIFFHGGGWVVGNLDTHDRIMRELAWRSGFAVFGVDYPLSPENRFPDSYQASLEVVKKVLAGDSGQALDPDRVVLAGDSAGAHLSLYCALQLKSAQLPPLRALVLIYGAYGLLDSASRRLLGHNEVGFCNASMEYYIRALMGAGVNPASAGYDLLGCDLAGLPPSLITTCSLDLLRDDGIVLASMMSEQNVTNELVNYEGVLHGYVHMSRHVDAAVETLDRCAEWIKRYAL